MSNKNSKVKDVLLDLLAFILALFATGLIFLIYPLHLGITALIILVVLSFGFVLDTEKLPKPIQVFCNYMALLCILAFIFFVIAMDTADARIYLGLKEQKALNAGLALFSIATYIFLYIRASFHESDREAKRRAIEKAEKQNANRQNYMW